ncbi:hypothetical protein HDU97_005361 [Phlyctochytrium planicorne]|nr:hypothetical protein HDU97_005361 [Phlyctochytrium planicorne]
MQRPDLPTTITEAKEYREVSPGSQPDAALPRAVPISKYYYFNRDARRAYPATTIYTQEDVKAFALASGSKPLLAAGDSAQTTAISTTADGAVSSEGEFFPPVINRRYKWTPSMPHLKADHNNPQLCIRGMNRIDPNVDSPEDDLNLKGLTSPSSYGGKIGHAAALNDSSSPPRNVGVKHHHNAKRPTGDAIANQLEYLYAKQAAALIQEGDEKFNHQLREHKELLENFIGFEDAQISAIAKDRGQKYIQLLDQRKDMGRKFKSRIESFQVGLRLSQLADAVQKPNRRVPKPITKTFERYKKPSQNAEAALRTRGPS